VKEMRIDHLEWQPGESREAALVLVSAEAASSTGKLLYQDLHAVSQTLECDLRTLLAPVQTTMSN
jgi:hypothetical protein